MNAGTIATTQASAPARTGQAEGAQGKQEADQGGGFGAILEQMLSGAQNGELAQMLMQTAQMGKRLTEEGGELAAQMLAELFAGSGILPIELIAAAQGAVPTQMIAQGTALQTNALVLDDAQQLLGTTSQQDAQAALLTQLTKGAAQPPEALQQVQQLYGAVGKENPTIVKENRQSQPLTLENGQQQNQLEFLDAVAKAKEELRQGTGTPNEKQKSTPMNIEQLQQEVDSGKYRASVEELRLAAVGKEQAPPLTEQLKTGITQNLKLGKNEFVIKLQPEGLGEITVKVVETNNKLALSIVTSSAQTARLINSGIGELRDSLRVYHAEISEVVEQSQYASQQQGFGQSFAGKQHQHQPQQHRSNSVYSWTDTANEMPDEEQPSEQLLSELDTYI